MNCVKIQFFGGVTRSIEVIFTGFLALTTNSLPSHFGSLVRSDPSDVHNRCLTCRRTLVLPDGPHTCTAILSSTVESTRN